MFLRSHPVKTSRENPKLKGVTGLLAVLCVAGPVYAQEASHARPNPTEFNILTDARIGLAKAVLQLTPEQARFWPPVEEAIRSRAVARMHRIGQLKALAERAGQRDFNPAELMRGRAEALAERSASLKKLADAVQPLYQSLSPDQKERMRLVAMHFPDILRDVAGAVERRRLAEIISESGEGDED